jgi:ubiquinone/menaquinone biosynthesis C-methylase UbiE
MQEVELMAGESPQETYTHGYSDEALWFFLRRTATVDADFFIPHLRSGMAVLDCGCGPGSITVDLANIVGPGQVIGVDIAEERLAGARDLAAACGIANVRFERGNIYDLPFPEHSFDAAFANHVLEHLRDPVRALKEVRRVLKPGGVVGICNDDWKTLLLEPSTPVLTSAIALFMRVADQNGAGLCRGHHNRQFLRNDR